MDRKQALELLPGKIKVIVRKDRMGHLFITPTDKRIKKLVGATSSTNHAGDVYLQADYEINDFLERYPKSRMVIAKSRAESFGGHKIGRRWYVANDCVKFMIDTWDFLQLVGGQSE